MKQIEQLATFWTLQFPTDIKSVIRRRRIVIWGLIVVWIIISFASPNVDNDSDE